MDANTIRAWHAHRQGLDGSLIGATPAEVLDRSGWTRSIGGAGPYLSLFARARLSREAIDDAVAQLAIHELPAARGCTYVVPARDFGLALRVGQGFSDDAQIVTARNYCGVTDAELAALNQAVLDALATGPLDPRELKEALGDLVRNLGVEGKKRGMTTTLPLALGKLQSSGSIRRVPINGRLDQQRYRYIRWDAASHSDLNLTAEAANTKLAQRFWEWIGLATPAHFQWISGLSAKAARPAIATLNLVPLTAGDDRLIARDDLDALRMFRRPDQPHFTLTSTLDNITHLRRDIRGLVGIEDQDQRISQDRGEQSVSSLSELPSHLILDRGQLIGLWEFDPAQGAIVWATFSSQPASLRSVIAETETFIRDQLGDMRSFSLDSPESRAPRLKALRMMQNHV